MLTIFFLFSLTFQSFYTKKLNFGTFNTLNQEDPLGALDARTSLKEEYLADILESEEIDVLCLQETGETIEALKTYLNDEKLNALYPYQYSILDTLSEAELGNNNSSACDLEQQEIMGKCIVPCEGLLISGGISAFGFCIASTCPEATKILPSECSNCFSGVFSDNPNLSGKEIIDICSLPNEINLRHIGSGEVLLSKYELLDNELTLLPSWWVKDDYLITSRIRIKGRDIIIGCTHFHAPLTYESLNLPYFNYHPSIRANLTTHRELLTLQIEETLEILNALGDKKPKILLGDINTDPIITPEVYKIFSEYGYASLIDLDTNDNIKCTWCNIPSIDSNYSISTDNICTDNRLLFNPLINENDFGLQLLDNIFIKDFKHMKNFDDKVKLFLMDCYSVNITQGLVSITLSDHYAIKGSVKIHSTHSHHWYQFYKTIKHWFD